MKSPLKGPLHGPFEGLLPCGAAWRLALVHNSFYLNSVLNNCLRLLLSRSSTSLLLKRCSGKLHTGMPVMLATTDIRTSGSAAGAWPLEGSGAAFSRLGLNETYQKRGDGNPARPLRRPSSPRTAHKAPWVASPRLGSSPGKSSPSGSFSISRVRNTVFRYVLRDAWVPTALEVTV